MNFIFRGCNFSVHESKKFAFTYFVYQLTDDIFISGKKRNTTFTFYLKDSQKASQDIL